MAGILGLGATHSPLLVGNDAGMAGIFERLLQNPRVPPSSTNPANWPTAMQQEWAAHQAGEAPAAHRKRAMEGFRAVRAALDAFNPDFLLIFGDDQYENFREDGVAPFCVFALDAIESHPYHRTGAANAWGEPRDTVVRHIGHRAGGRYLARSLIEQGFDISYAYTMRHEAGLPHAFINALLLLDNDRRGLPWPIVPFHVNCYGYFGNLQARCLCSYRWHRIGRTRSAWAIACTLLRSWRRHRACSARLALARRRHGLIELVAFLPDRKAPLSLSRPRIRPSAFRGNARRPVGSLAGADYGAVGRCRAAGVAELGVRGWRDDGTRPTAGVDRSCGNLHLRCAQGICCVRSRLNAAQPG